MNLPNVLTSIRFLLIPVYIVIFANGHMIPAFLVVVAAGVTDVLDGYIARRYGQVTTVGVMLDPLADKLMLITVIVSLLVAGHLSLLAAGAMFVRDLGMIAGGLTMHFRGKQAIPANWLGKLTTVLFYVALMLIFFQAPIAHVFLWFVISMSYVATLVYIASYSSMNHTAAGKPPAEL